MNMRAIAQGLANRRIPDSLPAVEWLTTTARWLSGMKPATHRWEYTHRLHRETLRSFGRYELTHRFIPPAGSYRQHLNNSLLSDRDYTERQRRTHPHQQPAPDLELQLAPPAG